MTGLKVDLDKLVQGIRVDLEKRVEDPNKLPNDINVTLALDVSGSMSSDFRNGAVLHALQRIVAISKTIDDDGILNFYCFSEKSFEQPSLDAEKDFPKLDKLVRKLSNEKDYNWWSGTDFSPVLSDIIADHNSNTSTESTSHTVEVQVEPRSLMQRILNVFRSFFSMAKVYDTQRQVVESVKTITNGPVETETKQLVILITDGQNSDRRETEALFKSMQKDKRYFFQCVVVGCSNSFLKDSANAFSNVGYTEISSFTEDDTSLIQAILSDKVLRHFGY